MTPEFARGFRASVPAGIGVLVYGLVFGVLAAEKGVSAPMLAVMNVAVFSGSAQFILVGMWGGGFPAWQVALAAAVVNVRYFLLTAAVAPLLGPFGKIGSAWRVHFVTDENWAVTMARAAEGRSREIFLWAEGFAWGCSGFSAFWQATASDSPSQRRNGSALISPSPLFSRPLPSPCGGAGKMSSPGLFQQPLHMLPSGCFPAPGTSSWEERRAQRPPQ